MHLGIAALLATALGGCGLHRTAQTETQATDRATLGTFFNMGLHARLAYSNPTEIRAKLQEAGIRDVTMVEDRGSGLFSYFVKMPDYTIIAVRGSQGWLDLLQNLRFDEMDAKPGLGITGKVHIGYHAQAKAAVEKLAQQLPKGKPLWVTGHSLGGSIAALIGASLTVKHGFKVDGVVTFGAPKIGNLAFQGSFNTIVGDRTINFALQRDIAPRLPPHELAEADFSRHFPNFLLQKYIERGFRGQEFGCFGKRYLLDRDNGSLKMLTGKVTVSGQQVDDWGQGCRDDDLNYWKATLLTRALEALPEGNAIMWATRLAIPDNHLVEAYIKSMCHWGVHGGRCPVD